MNMRFAKMLPGLALVAIVGLPTVALAQGPGMMGPGSGPYHEEGGPYGRGYGPGYGPGYGMGPGMMGYGGYGMGPGMGPGMMGGYGPGYGPGYGRGPGMMGYGGYGMGPGMGRGMMGGYGPGYGMGYGPGYGIKLTDKQRQEFIKIQQETMQKNWGLMGAMHEQMLKLQELYGAATVDPKAVGEVYDRIAALRKQMLENGIEAQNRMQKHLTKEQRETWRNMRRGMGWGPGMMYEE